MKKTNNKENKTKKEKKVSKKTSLKKIKPLKPKVILPVGSKKKDYYHNNSKALKPLGELKFESVGDEYLFLFDTISQLRDDLPQNVSIEHLRIWYRELVSECELLEDKYEKTSIYWKSEQEEAIVQYINETDSDKRNEIFSKNIYKSLKKLVENIIFTYKLFRNDSRINEVQSDCVSFLITKIDGFNPSTGAKAFAYLGTIARHYLMGLKKTKHKLERNSVDIDVNIDEVSEKPENIYYINSTKELKEGDKTERIFNKIIIEIEKEIQREDMSDNDKKVGESITWFFRNHEIMQIYNKNLIFHLIKERTGLNNTKDISDSLKKFRAFYKLFKYDFNKKENNG